MLDRSISSVVEQIAIGTEGLGFDSRADQTEHSVAKGSLTLWHFLGAAKMDSTTRYILRRNIAGRVNKDLI